MLIHPRVGDIAADQRVLGPLLQLMPRDDLFDRQLARGRHVAALDENLRRALAEVDQHRAARHRHLRGGDAGFRDAVVVGDLQRLAVREAVDAGRPSTGSVSDSCRSSEEAARLQ